MTKKLADPERIKLTKTHGTGPAVLGLLGGVRKSQPGLPDLPYLELLWYVGEWQDIQPFPFEVG